MDENTVIAENFDLEAAKKRVTESLKSAEDFRKRIVDPSTGMNFEQLWNEEEMLKLAISTLGSANKSVVDYYDPKVYAAIKRVVDRVKNAPFEGARGNYYDLEPVETNDIFEVKSGKKVLDVHLNKSKMKEFLKEMIWDGAFMDLAIGKLLPDKKVRKVTTRRVLDRSTGDYEKGQKTITEQQIGTRVLDIFNVYFENPYEADLDKNNITEVYETTISSLKKEVGSDGLPMYENLESVKPGITSDVYGITANFKAERRDKLKEEEVKAGRILVAEYWGEFEVDGKDVQVNIVLAGDVVIRATINELWHGHKPYITWTWEKIKESVYGFSLARRLLKTQWAINQVYNLDIRGSINRSSGARISHANVAAYLEKQMPGGKIKPGQQLQVQTNRNLAEVTAPLDFPDVHMAASNIRAELVESVNDTAGSSKLLSGKPTGTQLDRTGVGINAAITEANVSIKDVILALQDNLIKPAVEMFYQLLQQFLDEDTVIKTIAGNYKSMPASSVATLVNVKVFGGSLFLERAKQVNDIEQLLGMLKGINKIDEQVNIDELVVMYLEAKDLPTERIKKSQNPITLALELLTKITPDQMIQFGIQAKEMYKKKEEKERRGMETKAKQEFVQEVTLDDTFEQAKLKRFESTFGALNKEREE